MPTQESAGCSRLIPSFIDSTIYDTHTAHVECTMFYYAVAGGNRQCEHRHESAACLIAAEKTLGASPFDGALAVCQRSRGRLTATGRYPRG